ncbi:MAG TPA: hypothetical protein VM388_01805 [Acidimicrobiales bacterium]|nr:hypothetical protein [Acidimicrobiales bacterium]
MRPAAAVPVSRLTSAFQRSTGRWPECQHRPSAGAVLDLLLRRGQVHGAPFGGQGPADVGARQLPVAIEVERPQQRRPEPAREEAGGAGAQDLRVQAEA